MGSVDLTIRKMTNRSRGFYSLMGPFLARREIAKELGNPTWDDDDVLWFVAMKDGEACGFCALQQSGGKAYLRSDYVLPGKRRKRIYESLFKARLRAIERPAKARAVVRPDAVALYARNGFTETRITKNFHIMEADLS